MQASHEPKTLFEARNVIKSLRAQLGGGPPAPKPPPAGDKPIPKVDPQPAPNPDPSKPGMPGTMDLSLLPPKKLGEFLECCSTVVLHKLLSAETSKGCKQNSSVVQKIYREIKKR